MAASSAWVPRSASRPAGCTRVALSAPSGGATVSGITTVSATASDNIGVVGVQFRLDGAALGAEDLTAPYSLSWNTLGSNDLVFGVTKVVVGPMAMTAGAAGFAGGPPRGSPLFGGDAFDVRRPLVSGGLLRGAAGQFVVVVRSGMPGSHAPGRRRLGGRRFFHGRRLGRVALLLGGGRLFDRGPLSGRGGGLLGGGSGLFGGGRLFDRGPLSGRGGLVGGSGLLDGNGLVGSGRGLK